ncbi:MAG: hypothetical protein M1824_000216 [Vezdaea acicularis]|nr:MAG: hypothetical protein M1824_000216 [Vezdaea acicularis]
MSVQDFEYRVVLVLGEAARPILHRALDCCRDGRYNMRDRREQRLGDFVSTWQEYERSIRQTATVFPRISAPLVVQSLTYDYRQALTLSENAIATLASNISVTSTARTKELVQDFLDALYDNDSMLGYISAMRTMMTKLDAAMQTAMREDALSNLSYASPVAADLPEDEGYAEYSLSRGPSMTRREASRSHQPAYINTQSVPQSQYDATSAAYSPRGDSSYGYEEEISSPTSRYPPSRQQAYATKSTSAMEASYSQPRIRVYAADTLSPTSGYTQQRARTYSEASSPSTDYPQSRSMVYSQTSSPTTGHYASRGRDYKYSSYQTSAVDYRY